MARFGSQPAFGDYRSTLSNEVSLSYLTGIPDPSLISSPALIVIFKSLLKRDSTTKEKALIELLSFIEIEANSNDIINDSHLQRSWVLIYSKLSIDVSISVRSLSHKIHGSFCKLLGKLSTKHLKDSIGPWIAGTFDVDRSVGASAQQALDLVFPNSEKQDALYNIFEESLLDFVLNTIQNESISSLSDERYVSADDAEAKYFRVMKSCVSILSKLVQKRFSTSSSVKKSTSMIEKYKEILGYSKLWKFSYSTDVSLSRSIFDLIIILVKDADELIQDYLSEIASNVVYKCLKSCQPLVSTYLLQALISLTRKFPNIWDLANSKKTSFEILCKFISNGSRRSGVYYWPSLLALLTALPENISPYSNKKNRDEVLKAIYEGIQKESILSKHHGWGGYLSVVEKSYNNDDGVVEDCLSNLINDIVIVDRPTRLSPELIVIVSKKLSSFISLDWNAVNKSLQTGLNEISKRKSKDSLKNFITILKSIDINKQKVATFLFNQLSILFINLKSGLDTFEIHIIKTFLEAFEKLLLPNDSLINELNEFIIDNLSAFIVSDSNEDLVRIVELYGKYQNNNDLTLFQKAIEDSFNSILKSSFEDKKLNYLSTFLKSSTSLKGLVNPIDSVSQYLRYLLSEIEDEEGVGEGDGESLSDSFWDSILYGICSHDVFITEDTTNDALKFLCIITDSPSEKTLYILQKLLSLDNEYFTRFISTSGKEFFSHLWTIESNPSVDKLLNAIEKPATGNFNVLCERLLEEVEENISIDIIPLLVERGQRLIISDEVNKKSIFEKLLFIKDGEKTIPSIYLDKIFSNKVNSELSVADCLGGAVLLVEGDDNDLSDPNDLYKLTSIVGFCKSLIIENKELFFFLQQSNIEEIILFIGYCYEIISSATFLGLLNTENENESIIFQIANDLLEFISDLFKDYSTDQFILAIEGNNSSSSLQDTLISSLWISSSNLNSKSYYSTRFLATIFNNVINQTNDSQIDPIITKLRPKFKNNPLATTAFLYGFQKYLLQSTTLSNLRNQLSSDLIGLSSEKLNQSGLKTLIHLNLLLDISPNDVSNELIPLNRLLMFLRPLFSWHNSDGFNNSFINPRIELTKLLTKFISLYPTTLPSSIWESCIEVLEQNFISMSESLPLKYYNLRYIITFQKLISKVTDLEEIWNEKSNAIYEELFDTLYTVEPDFNQPERLTNIQLQKALLIVPTKLLDYDKVYNLLSIPSTNIQRTAFILLTSHIPSLQEERSIEYELEKTRITSDDDDYIVSFPDHLLSIISQIPSNDINQMTSYLLSWQLIFDHFKNASYDLRRAYINKLRNDSYIDSLLNLISQYILDGTLNKPAEKNKELNNIDNYNGTMIEENDEVDFLLLRSYFLILQYTGSLAKSWFLNVKKRSLILAVEKFTEKYISPMIIKKELNNVESTLQSSNSINDDTMSTKIIRSINEVRAYYTTDDQTMEIAIKIPILYPLRDLQVEGIKRIGVREKQWRAWLLASQAIGTAQNGSIIDSLELFKRNVSMHFEGIDECAICYSILHEDHTLPNKTCTTCKKKFHADCLYKWFKSAGSSSCPLCRTTFSFRHGIN